MLPYLFALGLGGVACGGGDGVTTTPLTSEQHAEQLAKGESAALAAELVGVSGYFYQDVSNEELQSLSELVSRGGMTPLAMSFHGIRDLSSGDEIAFLQLYALDPTDAVHAPANWVRYARSITEAEDVLRLEFSGQTVFFAEEPSDPESRYKYAWLRHGTAAEADGPDRAALESWIKAYFALPVVLPGENPALVDRLVAVPGFAYANETRPSIVEPFAEEFAGADYSIHYVFDEVHEFGAFVLIGPAPSLTEQRFITGIASSLEQLTGVRRVEVPPIEMEGMVIHRLLSKGSDNHITTFVWWWADAAIGGALATERPDIGEPFLKAFFAAQTS